MAETIESFVAKLQSEGVEAGRQAADKLLSEAKKHSEEIIKDAETKSQRTIESAQRQAAELLERSRSELELAARDVLLKLRSALNRAIGSVLAHKTKGPLSDSKFLAKTLHELILLYAKADIERSGQMVINVSPELQGELADWAIGELSRKAEEAGLPLDLKGYLKTAGFEYTVSGGTVEVTPESVVETICEIVNPRLREVIEAATRHDQTSDAEKRTG